MKIYSFNDSSISIIKNDLIVVIDNLSSNKINTYDNIIYKDSVIKINSNDNILVSLEGNSWNDFRPLVPLDVELFSAGNSNNSYIAVNTNEAGLELTEECSDGKINLLYTDTNGYVKINYGKQNLYDGISCIYSIENGLKIIGTSFADSNGYDATTFLPKKYFQKITPIPFNTDYIKIVGSTRADCSFKSYDNVINNSFALNSNGSSEIFHHYSENLSSGLINCDSLVMVVAQDNDSDDDTNIIVPWSN